MKFELDEQAKIKLNKFIEEQDKKVLEKQKERKDSYPFSSVCPQPYYGCMGTGYTYSFTPSSIGMFISVTNNSTKDSIELSDSENF